MQFKPGRRDASAVPAGAAPHSLSLDIRLLPAGTVQLISIKSNLQRGAARIILALSLKRLQHQSRHNDDRVAEHQTHLPASDIIAGFHSSRVSWKNFEN